MYPENRLMLFNRKECCEFDRSTMEEAVQAHQTGDAVCLRVACHTQRVMQNQAW